VYTLWERYRADPSPFARPSCREGLHTRRVEVWAFKWHNRALSDLPSLSGARTVEFFPYPVRETDVHVNDNATARRAH
jgi:hypothetical protein